MTIRNWIRNREIHGIGSFSYKEISNDNPGYSENVLRNELYRLSKSKTICSVYRGYYVIVPTQYKLTGIIPPSYYIDQLMNYLEKPYYVSLLSAGELHSAAHQRPQRFFLTTVLPTTQTSENKNEMLVWTFRREIPKHLLESRNTETGQIFISNPELTAVDLVQYCQYVGGMARATEVISELAEKTDFTTAAKNLIPYVSVTSVQRLGYILENILYEKKQADILYSQILEFGQRFRTTLLDKRSKSESEKIDNRWKILYNNKIELDIL